MSTPSCLNRLSNWPDHIFESPASTSTNTNSPNKKPPYPLDPDTPPPTHPTSALLALPRELRDMIYTAILLTSHPTPLCSSTQNPDLWHRPCFSSSFTGGLDTHSYAASRAQAPRTCANFLSTSRQVHDEMQAVMRRGRGSGVLDARLDCLVRDGGCWFSWVRIPVVRTRVLGGQGEGEGMSGWGWGWVKSWVGGFWQGVVGRGIECEEVVTVVERLWIDVRLCDGGIGERGEDGDGDGAGAGAGAAARHGERNKTSWAICAVLHHFLSHGPEITPAPRPLSSSTTQSSISIDELVLNVLPSPPPPPTTNSTTSAINTSISTTNSPTTTTPKTQATTLAKELVNIWLQLWAAGEPPTQYYSHLLEKIGRVRVCVEGVEIGARVLRGELERGRREARRLEMRRW